MNILVAFLFVTGGWLGTDAWSAGEEKLNWVYDESGRDRTQQAAPDPAPAPPAKKSGRFRGQEFFGDFFSDILREFKFATGGPEIEEGSDASAVFYKVKVKGDDQEKVNIKIDDRQIHISGRTETKSGNMVSSSSFHRIFPIPEGTDPSKVEMKKESDHILIRIPFKTKSR